MQIIFNSCLTLLLSMIGLSAFAAGDVQPAHETPAETMSMRSEMGQVEGFFRLAVGDDAIDATYVADKTGRHYGNVLILPDSDGNIDSYDLVHTLRTKLAEAGWSTMTVDLHYSYEPQILSSTQKIAKADATIEQVAEATDEASSTPETVTNLDQNAARVTAAMSYLNEQQAGPMVVVCMGKSAELSATAIAQAGDDNALIWIGPDWDLQQPPESVRVLDITPSIFSNMAESTTAQRRAVMMRQNIQQYSFRQINGATSGFYGFELPIFYVIRNWLHKNFVQGATR